ncbi:hypothetical protein Tco_1389552, partial [Tanacetum coccineum]
ETWAGGVVGPLGPGMQQGNAIECVVYWVYEGDLFGDNSAAREALNEVVTPQIQPIQKRVVKPSSYGDFCLESLEIPCKSHEIHSESHEIHSESHEISL